MPLDLARMGHRSSWLGIECQAGDREGDRVKGRLKGAILGSWEGTLHNASEGTNLTSNVIAKSSLLGANFWQLHVQIGTFSLQVKKGDF